MKTPHGFGTMLHARNHRSVNILHPILSGVTITVAVLARRHSGHPEVEVLLSQNETGSYRNSK